MIDADKNGAATPKFSTPMAVGQFNNPSWSKLRSAFEAIFERHYFINNGPAHRELEAALASFLEVEHVICYVNGTSALMALLEAGQLSGEVIVPSFAHPSLAQAVWWAGLKPRFCDVDQHTHSITPENIGALINNKTTAILATHMWGAVSFCDELDAMASKNGIKLFFDAAQGFGASIESGRLGTFGDGSIFSFNESNIINCAEGGCVATNDAALAEKVKIVRGFNTKDPLDRRLKRINGKMSEAQAAMGLLSLEDYGTNANRNQGVYSAYKAAIEKVPGVHFVDHAANQKSNHQNVIIEVDEEAAGLDAEKLCDLLARDNVMAKRPIPSPVHKLPPFCDENANLNLPVTEKLTKSVVQLPSGGGVTPEMAKTICSLIEEATGDADGKGSR